jgi:FkbM family methyltransferase
VSAPLAPAPLWFRLGRAAVRRLPAGRFRAFDLLARGIRSPFEDRLGPEAGGARFRCDLRHLVAREACLTGRHAPDETALVRQALGAGDVFVDVGANFGYFTLLAASVVGGAGTVVALEPDPRMAAELRENVRTNGLENVRVLEVAAAAAEGRARLSGYEEAGGNWGTSSLVGGGSNEAPSYDVRCAPLDALLDAAGVDGVALVKVDVEGAEGEVLRGMHDGLARGRYARVLVELHPWLHEDAAAEHAGMWALFTAAGYRAWKVDEDPVRLRRGYYGASGLAPLRPGDGAEGRAWHHVLWVRGGDA